MEQHFQCVDQKVQYDKNSDNVAAHFAQYFNQNPNPQQCREIIKFEILSMVNPIGSMETWSEYSCTLYIK